MTPRGRRSPELRAPRRPWRRRAVGVGSRATGYGQSQPRMETLATCSRDAAASSRHTLPPIRRTVASRIRLSRVRPRIAASADTVARARKAPSPTDTGSWYFTTRPAVSSCDRSPHSATKSTRKLAPTARNPCTPGLALASNSCSISASSASALPAPRIRMKPPTRNIKAAKISTGVRGSRPIRPPSVTAMTVCTAKAKATPIQTASGLYRVARTSVAMNVLSGSSMGKISRKAVRAMAKLMVASSLTTPRPGQGLALTSGRAGPDLAVSWNTRAPGGQSSYAAVVNLSQDAVSTLVVVALGAVAIALAIAVGAQLRLSRVQARYRVLWAGGEKDVAAVLADQSSEIAQLRSDVARVRDKLAGSAGDIEQSLRHVAVVRYDAFGDMGGRLSFSAAIVDDRGDGLVISSINARGESRTYAKGIVDGDSEVTLSPEEQQALAAARTGRGGS